MYVFAFFTPVREDFGTKATGSSAMDPFPLQLIVWVDRNRATRLGNT